MQHSTTQVLSVTEAATILGIAPRTVRRWLHEGYLTGQKIGTSWVVLCPAERASSQPQPGETGLPQEPWRTHTLLRQRLRQLGARLITVGNAVAGARRARGEVFLTWRRLGRLPITFAIGRASPTRSWAPHALGTALPFWLKERQQWRPVQRLLRQYEQLRCWCHPRLLRLPQVVEIVEAELLRLQAAVDACAAQAVAQGRHQTARGDCTRTEQ
jgi:excisionase family DNA binding protein